MHPLEKLKHLCERKFGKKSELFDSSPKALRKGLRLLGKHGLLALKAPNELGGFSFNKKSYFLFVELLQSYSGALGFIQRQHQKAASLLALSHAKKSLVPQMASGRHLVGISLSHLRNIDSQAVVAKRAPYGVWISGQTFWVSGYRIFDALVLGFCLPAENKEGFAIIPFKKSKNLKIHGPLDLWAMPSLQTVDISFSNLFVPEEEILFFSREGPFGHV